MCYWTKRHTSVATKRHTSVARALSIYQHSRAPAAPPTRPSRAPQPSAETPIPTPPPATPPARPAPAIDRPPSRARGRNRRWCWAGAPLWGRWRPEDDCWLESIGFGRQSRRRYWTWAHPSPKSRHPAWEVSLHRPKIISNMYVYDFSQIIWLLLWYGVWL